MHSVRSPNFAQTVVVKCSWECITTIQEKNPLEHQPTAGQYLTHAHCLITRAVAAMDSCFGLVMASSARHSRRTEIALHALPRRAHSTPLSTSSTQHMWELLAGNRTAVPIQHALRRWIRLKPIGLSINLK